jgi:hypothetical protein
MRIKLHQEKKVKAKEFDISLVMSNWHLYIQNNTGKKVDIPVSMSFTLTGKIQIGFSYSNKPNVFESLEESLRFINNFINS